MDVSDLYHYKFFSNLGIQLKMETSAVLYTAVQH